MVGSIAGCSQWFAQYAVSSLWSDWEEFHYVARHFFFPWGIDKVNAIPSTLKRPQNFIILTSKSTPKLTQRTGSLEPPAAACLILVTWQKGKEGSEERQGATPHFNLSLLTFLSTLSFHPLVNNHFSYPRGNTEESVSPHWCWQALCSENVPPQMWRCYNQTPEKEVLFLPL